MSEDNEEEVKAIAEEARASFSLADRLKNRPMRTAKVVVSTDEVTGNKRLEVEQQMQRISEGATSLKQLATLAGEVGQDAAKKALERLAAKHVVDQDAYDKLEAESEALKADLRASSITFNLQAVPPVILKDAHREARKQLKIKDKSVPEDRQDEFTTVVTNIVLTKAVVSYVDNGSGATVQGITQDDAGLLQDQLPPSEWERIDTALGDLNFKNSVGEWAVDDADFSQAS